MHNMVKIMIKKTQRRKQQVFPLLTEVSSIYFCVFRVVIIGLLGDKHISNIFNICILINEI